MMAPGINAWSRRSSSRFVSRAGLLLAFLLLGCLPGSGQEKAVPPPPPPVETGDTNLPPPASVSPRATSGETAATDLPASNAPAADSPLPEIQVTTNSTASSKIPDITFAESTSATPLTQAQVLANQQRILESARNLRLTRQADLAVPLLVQLLTNNAPESLDKPALLELALVAQDQNDLSRAQQIFAQFLNRWPNDPRVPEVLLHQGQVFRQMGLNDLALAKFYSVMTAALVLKNDQIDYYQRLVLQAQTEIADTEYGMGRYADAADFFTRLLKENNPALNRAQTQYRLIRCLVATDRFEDAVSQSKDFLDRYAAAPEQPEVRFCLAQALKKMGRNSDALQQVLTLLQEQRQRTQDHPEVWAYWQQRAGNEIANQLYREGDYTKALSIYLNLAQLDDAPAWKLPVSYQIGMTYERLMQPGLATQTYSNIISAETTVGTNASPGLKAVFDMARWRINFLNWESKAEAANRSLMSDGTNATPPAAAPETAKLLSP
ncbi:MAG TPA: tetratricopeptide repeat protein [Dongiaceae bacterium]|nr:tetratricopeptide repeat protein [Dongiaceae bacterium]